MEITENYLEGFCKTAEAQGIDPKFLVKFAEENGLTRFLDGIANAYSNTDPSIKHGLIGGLATGLTGLAFSEGDFNKRLLKGLALGTLGGLGTYGLSRSGLWNDGIDWISDKLNDTKIKKPIISTPCKHV